MSFDSNHWPGWGTAQGWRAYGVRRPQVHLQQHRHVYSHTADLIYWEAIVRCYSSGMNPNSHGRDQDEIRYLAWGLPDGTGLPQEREESVGLAHLLFLAVCCLGRTLTQ